MNRNRLAAITLFLLARTALAVPEQDGGAIGLAPRDKWTAVDVLEVPISAADVPRSRREETGPPAPEQPKAAESGPRDSHTSDKRPPSIGVGSWVRYTKGGLRALLNWGAVQGVVTAVNDESITVMPKKGHSVTIPRSAAGSLEVSVGQRRRLRRGALVGAVLLGTLGAGIGAYGNAWCLGPGCEAPTSGEIRNAAAVGVVVGAALGAALTRPEEKWVATPFPPTPAAPASRTFRVDPVLNLSKREAGVRMGLSW